MKKNTMLLYMALICLSYNAFGQNKYAPVEDPDILKEQKRVLAKQHPHVFDQQNIKDVYNIDDSHAIVSYTDDHVYHEAIINSDRKDMMLLETAKLISLKDLPEIVVAAFKAGQHGDWEIRRQFAVDRPTVTDLYRLDIAKDEKTKEVKTLYFSRTGARIKSAL